jgi:hypothetical protein
VKTVAVCRHCHTGRASRAKGLCWRCSRSPDVRKRYPSTSKYTRRGLGHFAGPAPLPTEPTRHPPGSPGKLAVMAERARRKQSLFHPDDTRDEDERDRSNVSGI